MDKTEQNRHDIIVKKKTKHLSFTALQPQILDSFKTSKSNFLPIFFFVHLVQFSFVFPENCPIIYTSKNQCTPFQVILHPQFCNHYNTALKSSRNNVFSYLQLVSLLEEYRNVSGCSYFTLETQTRQCSCVKSER